jgi:hypothetical protein
MCRRPKAAARPRKTRRRRRRKLLRCVRGAESCCASQPRGMQAAAQRGKMHATHACRRRRRPRRRK